MNEMGIRKVDRLSGSHIGRSRQETLAHQQQRQNQPVRRSYEEVAVELKRALKDLTSTDITIEQNGGSRTYFPRFPENVVALMRELKSLDEGRMRSDFGKWRDVYPSSNDAVYFNTDSPDSFQRSHFPNGGIQPNLRGINLGYKLYRALLRKTGYLSSNSAGTREKDKVWASMLSHKQNPDGTPSVDDAYAVIGPGNWMAIDKNYRNAADIAMNFIERSIGFSATEPDRFDMDDDLIAMMPDAFLSKLNQSYLRSLLQDDRISQEKFETINRAASEVQRLEAERRRREQEEARRRREEADRENARRYEARIRRYGADLNADWQVGDYIVVKSYLLQDYDPLPIRQVVHRKTDGTYIAVSIKQAIRIANGEITWREANDTRTTSDKSQFAKVNLEAIPDLGNVALDPAERAYIESILTPERREEMENSRREAERQRLEADAATNAERAENEQTFGPLLSNAREVSAAISSRQNLPNFRIINTFKQQNAVSVIALTTQQFNSLPGGNRAVDVFVPVMQAGRGGLRAVGVEEIRRNPDRISLLNLVTGHVVTPPLAGLPLMFFELSEVSREDKRRVRGGDLFYIANHRNVFGVVAPAEYGTRNTADQAFIYMNVMGPGARGTAVRIDLLRRVSAPMSFNDLVGGGGGNQ